MNTVMVTMLARLPPAFLRTDIDPAKCLPRLRVEAHHLLALLIAEAGLTSQPDDAPTVGNDAGQVSARRHLLTLLHVFGRSRRHRDTCQCSNGSQCTYVFLHGCLFLLLDEIPTSLR